MSNENPGRATIAALDRLGLSYEAVTSEEAANLGIPLTYPPEEEEGTHNV